jgi:hypothetical protein
MRWIVSASHTKCKPYKTKSTHFKKNLALNSGGGLLALEPTVTQFVYEKHRNIDVFYVNTLEIRKVMQTSSVLFASF